MIFPAIFTFGLLLCLMRSKIRKNAFAHPSPAFPSESSGLFTIFLLIFDVVFQRLFPWQATGDMDGNKTILPKYA
jgi:hypothetical protein